MQGYLNQVVARAGGLNVASEFLALWSAGVHSQLAPRITALMPLAILHFAIVLALIGKVIAAPPPGGIQK